MAITVKNNKSAKELAGHIKRKDEIIFNAGSQTGAKKSDYKFNDVMVTVPGSNLQVKIPPQETHTFDVESNSIIGHALNNAKKELGLDNNDGGDSGNIVYLTFIAQAGQFECDLTYDDIAKMTGNIQMVFQAIISDDYTGEDTTLVFNLNTEDNVTDLIRGNYQKYNSDDIVKSTDIIFYSDFDSNNDGYLVVSISNDNMWHIINNTYYNNDDSVFEILYTNNQLSIEKIQQGLDTSGKKYIVFSQSALEHLISLLSDLGCTEYQIQEIYPDDASVNLNFNIQSISLGEYMIPYGNVVYTSQDSFLNNAGSTYVYTNILPFLNIDLYNKEKFVQLNINVGDDEISLVDTDFVLPETIDTYDAEFSFDSSYNVSVTPSVTSVATDKFTKLASGVDGNTYKSQLPRTAYTETLDSDLFIVFPDGNTTTIPSGTVISRYYTTFFVGNGFESPYDGIIWYGDNKWNIGLKLSD